MLLLLFNWDGLLLLLWGELLLSRGELFDSLVGDLHGVPDLLAERAGWTILDDGEVGAGEVLGGGVLIESRLGDGSLPIGIQTIMVFFFISVIKNYV